MYQAKDQAFREVTKAASDYRIAVLDDDHAEVALRLDIFENDLNTAMKQAVKSPMTNIDLFVHDVLNAKTYGLLGQKTSASLDEARLRHGKARGNLETALDIARAHFSDEVDRRIFAFYQLTKDPHSNINLEHYRKDVVDAAVSGDKQKLQGVLDRIVHDANSTVSTNQEFYELDYIIGTMRLELRSGR